VLDCKLIYIYIYIYIYIVLITVNTTGVSHMKMCWYHMNGIKTPIILSNFLISPTSNLLVLTSEYEQILPAV